MSRLSDKQRKFIDAYLECLNATQAARSAGYKGTYESLRSIGSQNLTKPHIKSEIEKRLSQYSMSANEVIYRLSQQGRASIGDFIGLTETEAKTHPQAHLIKKFKRTSRVLKDGDIEERVEIELHDGQSALVHIGKAHGVFKDVTKHEFDGDVELLMQAWSAIAQVGVDPVATFKAIIEKAANASS